MSTGSSNTRHHRWRLSSHFSDLPLEFQFGAGGVNGEVAIRHGGSASLFVDYVCYVGLESTALRHSGLGEADESTIMGSLFNGEVFDVYPPNSTTPTAAAPTTPGGSAGVDTMEWSEDDHTGASTPASAATDPHQHDLDDPVCTVDGVDAEVDGGDDNDDDGDDAKKAAAIRPPFPMNIPSFAFPQGLRCVWHSGTERPRSHSFTLTQVRGGGGGGGLVAGRLLLVHQRLLSVMLLVPLGSQWWTPAHTHTHTHLSLIHI